MAEKSLFIIPSTVIISSNKVHTDTKLAQHTHKTSRNKAKEKAMITIVKN